MTLQRLEQVHRIDTCCRNPTQRYQDRVQEKQIKENASHVGAGVAIEGEACYYEQFSQRRRIRNPPELPV
jgi:hypothetical protein